MIETLQKQTKEEKLKELLYIHQNIELTHIPNNVYRIIDSEDGTHLVLNLGRVKTKNSKKENPLILIPSEMKRGEATTLEFQDETIKVTGPEEEKKYHTLLLAKAALETILTWREIPQDKDLALLEDNRDDIINLGPRGIPEDPSTISGYQMLNTINNELSNDSKDHQV